jgi:arylesterase / paraoxonase
MKSYKPAFFFVLFITLACYFIIKILNDSGEYKKITPHSGYACEKVPVASGPGDIALDPKAGIAFIASGGRHDASDGSCVPGAILAYSFRPPRAVPVDLTPRIDFDFHPRGIDLFRVNASLTVLFAVNRRAEGNSVEIFEFENMRLRHVASVKHGLLTSPNDIAASGPRSFYIANSCGWALSIGRTMETYFRLPLSYVLYYDGASFRMVVSDIVFASGIALSREGNKVFVSSLSRQVIKVYHRHAQDGGLLFLFDVPLGTHPERISVDEEGALWVACHPRLLQVVPPRTDGNEPPPSQVLRVAVSDDRKFSVSEMYLNAGGEIGASSAAAASGEKLLIGSALNPWFLSCEGSRAK